jgi:hypothetical protein
MLAVYSDNASTLRRIASAVPRSVDVFSTQEWDEFLVRAPRAECRILGISELSSGPKLGPSLAKSLHPLILVTSRNSDNAARAPGLSPADIVWNANIEDDLWTKIRRASSLGVLERIAACFRQSTRLPAALREALALACTAPRPITTVTELGTLVGRDRRTIWRLWHQHHAGETPVRIEDVLHWLILIRAVLHKEQDLSWHSVARTLGVHEQTLARFAQSLAGTNLGTLTFQGPFAVRDDFARKILNGLVDEGFWDILR